MLESGYLMVKEKQSWKRSKICHLCPESLASLHISLSAHSIKLTSLSRELPTECRCPGSWTLSWTRWAASGSRNINFQIPDTELGNMNQFECFFKFHLGVEVTVEDGVDILQDVTQLLQLPLHPSLHNNDYLYIYIWAAWCLTISSKECGSWHF